MDKSALLKPRAETPSGMPEADVDVPGVGTVRVRGLSRWELITAQKLEGKTLEQERFILSKAMLDPQMGEDDIAAWQKVSGPMEINAVAEKVNELSGIGKGAAKSGVPGDGNQPGA